MCDCGRQGCSGSRPRVIHSFTGGRKGSGPDPEGRFLTSRGAPPTPPIKLTHPGRTWGPFQSKFQINTVPPSPSREVAASDISRSPKALGGSCEGSLRSSAAPSLSDPSSSAVSVADARRADWDVMLLVGVPSHALFSSYADGASSQPVGCCAASALMSAVTPLLSPGRRRVAVTMATAVLEGTR